MKNIIVITTFNRPVFFRYLIESIANQNIDDNHSISCVIFDDGSDENVTKTNIRHAHEHFDHNAIAHTYVTVSNVQDEDRKNRCRFGININAALDSISRMSLLDDDDTVISYATDDNVYLPYKVQSILTQFSNKDVDVVYNKTLFQTVKQVGNFLETTPRAQGSKLLPDGIIGVPFDITRLIAGSQYNFIDHVACSHRLSVIRKLRQPFWDESKQGWDNGDWQFWCKLLRTTKKPFTFINGVLDVKFIHEKNAQTLNLESAGSDFKKENIQE